jgi:hypothetical protein
MAYSNVRTLIPVDQVAYYLQIDPYHFNSIKTSHRPALPNCDDVWYQHDWQFAGKVSRESIAMALARAERVVQQELSYYLIPQYTEETVRINSYHRPEYYNFYNSRGMGKSVFTRWGWVTEVGRQAKVAISANEVVAYSDVDGDGFDEIGEMVCATTATDPEEIRVYYPGKSAQDAWEIRPVTDITVVGGLLTIRIPKYMLALEELQEKAVDPRAEKIIIDGDDNDNFLQTVDIYRVYTDTSEQAVFQSENYENCGSGCSSYDETGCLYIRDSRLGILAVNRADYSAITGAWAGASFTSMPDKVTIYYRAGMTDTTMIFPSRQMNPAWEEMLVYYALTFLDTRLGGCSNTRNIWDIQTEDMARNSPEKGGFNMSWTALDNPFGTTRAAIRLWKHMNAPEVRLSRPVSMV